MGGYILRWIFRKWEGVMGTGWSWLRIETCGGHLWVPWGTFGFQKCGEFLDELQNQLASQEGLCSMVKVNIYIYTYTYTHTHTHKHTHANTEECFLFVSSFIFVRVYLFHYLFLYFVVYRSLLLRNSLWAFGRPTVMVTNSASLWTRVERSAFFLLLKNYK